MAILEASGGAPQLPVPNSSGTQAPRFEAPLNACDSHIHIYDDRFAVIGPSKRLPTNGTVADYRLLQKRIGTTRAVVVTPAPYFTNNRVALDAIEQLGRDNARGVAVVHPDVPDIELKRLAEGRVCGIRFTVFDPTTAVTDIEMIEPLARRVNDLGWHVQLHMRADQILENAEMLKRLPSTIVFDHMGRLSPTAGIGDPAFQVICQLIDNGRVWVKLSGAYLNTVVGPPSYSDATSIAQAYIQAAPERLVWGSDWPHPTEKESKPDDAVLFDLLLDWAPNATTRRKILVDNPAELYGF